MNIFRRSLAGLLTFGIVLSASACNSAETEETPEDTEEAVNSGSSNSNAQGLFDAIADLFDGGDASSSGSSYDESGSAYPESSSPGSPLTMSTEEPGFPPESWEDSSYSDIGIGTPEPEFSWNDGGDTLSILTWEENSDTVKMVDFFLREKGYDSGKVTIVNVGAKGEDAWDGYKQYLRGVDDADLMIFDSDWTAEYINDDSLTAPLSDIGLYRSDFPEAFDYTLSFGTNDEGEFKAVTFQATPGGFVYRADLAEQYLGVKSPDEMQILVRDWEEFEDTGELLYEASGGRTALQATEYGMWQAYQFNRNRPWVVDGKLVMDNAEDFYDIAMEMQEEHSLANDVLPWDSSWYDAIMDGKALGEFIPTWGLTTTGGGSMLENFTDGGDTALGRNMAICEGPSGWFWGGSYIGLSKKCDNASLAREFIEFYCKNASSMKAYAATTGDFMNNKTVMANSTVSNPLLNGQDHYKVLFNVLDKLDLEGKITKYDSRINALFHDSVNEYLDGYYATKREAIKAFKDNVAHSFPDIVVEY